MRKFKGLVSAVVLGASALVMTACGGPKPEDAALAFSKATFENDIEKVMTLVDTKGLSEDELKLAKGKLTVALTPVQTKAKMSDGYKGTKALSVDGNCANDGDACSVKVEHTFGDGSTDTGVVSLVNRDGVLKVSLK